MECRDCEDFLQLGIEAFRWLQKARRSYQDEVYGGKLDFNERIERRITRFYESWR